MIPDFDYRPPDVPLDILFQDDQIIVANKPAGLLSVPGKLAGREDCLVTRLKAAHWDTLLVHRLDCDTSGVMVFARTKQAQGFLGQEFEKRRAKKTYLARVWGQLAPDQGHIDLPLCADWPNRPRQMVDHVNGRPAQGLGIEAIEFSDGIIWTLEGILAGTSGTVGNGTGNDSITGTGYDLSVIHI